MKQIWARRAEDGKHVPCTVSTLSKEIARVVLSKVEGIEVTTDAPKRTSRKGIANHPIKFRRHLAKLVLLLNAYRNLRCAGRAVLYCAIDQFYCAISRTAGRTYP